MQKARYKEYEGSNSRRQHRRTLNWLPSQTYQTHSCGWNTSSGTPKLAEQLLHFFGQTRRKPTSKQAREAETPSCPIIQPWGFDPGPGGTHNSKPPPEKLRV